MSHGVVRRKYYPYGLGLYLIRSHDELYSVANEIDSIPGVWEAGNILARMKETLDEDYFLGKSIIVWHDGKIRHGESEINSVLFLKNQLIVTSTQTYYSAVVNPWKVSTIILIEIDSNDILDDLEILIPYNKIVLEKYAAIDKKEFLQNMSWYY